MAGKERLDSWHCVHVFPPTNCLTVKLQLLFFWTKKLQLKSVRKFNYIYGSFIPPSSFSFSCFGEKEKRKMAPYGLRLCVSESKMQTREEKTERFHFSWGIISRVYRVSFLILVLAKHRKGKIIDSSFSNL